MGRSHTQELLADAKPRHACDRCHAQKMRCLKAQSDDRCLRCARQDAVCQYSPRTQRKRPETKAHAGMAASSPGSSNTPAPLLNANLLPDPVMAANPDDLVSWGPLWSSSSSALDLAMDPLPENFECAAPGSYTLVDANTSLLSVADAVRELADLNVRLFDHSCTLPTSLQPTDTPLRRASSGRLFAIDQTFTLTKTLINILDRLYAHLDDNGPGSRPIDQATALLIMSCHCRLMDLYASIFDKIRVCSQNPQLTSPADEAAVTLPPLQFGSYTAPALESRAQSLPSLSTVSMHMMMVLMASSQLCKQLRESIVKDIGRVDGQPRSIFDEAAQKTLRERWGALEEDIFSVQQSLMLFSATSIAS